MKLKRILSSALLVVMIFTVFVGLVPVRAEAAHSVSSIDQSKTYTSEQIEKIFNYTYTANFASVEEKLNYEFEEGLIDYVNSRDNEYTLYINRVTGVVYYKNNKTGQILSTNPHSVAYGNIYKDTKAELMSQIVITYSKMTNSNSAEAPYCSATMSAEKGQMDISPIANGFRVSYTLGDMTSYLAPEIMTYEAYEKKIFVPMLEYVAQLLETYIGASYPDEEFYFFGKTEWGGRQTYDSGTYARLSYREYTRAMESLYEEALPRGSAEREHLDTVFSEIDNFRGYYSINNPKTLDLSKASDKEIYDAWIIKTPVVEKGVAAVYLNMTDEKTQARVSQFISKYAPDYTYSDMYSDEAECRDGKKQEDEKPMFRCALEYAFNNDGTLSVRVPANSISYDETKYILKEIAPLKYFGAGDLNNDGYVFIPDGSGSVIEFKDFYSSQSLDNPNVFISLNMYGNDYAHSSFSGIHHAEQVTMPVYGLVNEFAANTVTGALTGLSTVNEGYFAIIEEGSSMMNINVEFGGTSHKYGTAYSTFAPYTYEQLETSADITVGNDKTYTVVADAKYTGSYVTRYTMLQDEVAAVVAGVDFYQASYVGMANCYRDYLKGKGELTTLVDAGETLPLYIEALGSMEIVEKILTFPVTSSIPLTTFDDIATMYEEFSNAKTKLYDKYVEYDNLANAENKNAALKKKYRDKAASYYDLYLEVENITNINFKLTGFANGGMYFTYPTKVRWEKACGGESGFEKLLSTAASKNQIATNNFGIYPEFDFQYINNTAMFDGISNKNTVARLLDNRYASKQVYNSVIREYETTLAMVISSDALDRLYTKFLGNYSDYSVNGISVSTLGSDINSSFDKKNFISREGSLGNITSLLNRMSKDYSVLLSTGNAYTLKYADHIVNLSVDSSHLRNSSYTVPFVGMVLHGYVNYAGSPLNYSGSPDYEFLRAIESGASLYYVLCYQNTNHMKDDEALNGYYSVKYETWFDKIVEQYDRLNDYIGDLQHFEIADHTTIIAEKVISAKEQSANNERLKAEFLDMVRAQLDKSIDEAYNDMILDDANIGKGLKVTVDTDALLNVAALNLRISSDELIASDFDDGLRTIKEEYEAYYPGKYDEEENLTSRLLEFNSVEYSSKYDYYTESKGDVDGYDTTEYTVDNNQVIMVTYRNSYTNDAGETVNEEVKIVLNYNVYAVTVKLSNGETFELGKYEAKKIDLREA